MDCLLQNFLYSSFIVLIISQTSAQDVMNIEIERRYETEKCIQGYLFVNSKAIAYTMELPWKDNEVNISAIPKGKYSGIIRYDKKDGWRIQLENVPDRTGVQIHIGNYTSEIQGCTLVGLTVDTEKCKLVKSKEAYEKLKEAFYGSSSPISTPDIKIIVTYK